MEAVLETATVLSVCKMLCSLPFLSLVTHCRPLSFCCCCLLLFTDVALTVFLGVLLVLDLWKEAPSAGDIIALRALLFVSHTYGVVLVLTLPALIVDLLVKLQQEKNPLLLGEKNPLPLGEKNPPLLGEKNPLPLREKIPLALGEKNPPLLGEKNPPLGEEPVLHHDGGAYLCCLFLWIFGSLSVRWQWRLEELMTSVCMFSTDSLLFCLPNVLTVMFLRPAYLLLLAVTALLSAFLLSRLFKPHRRGDVTNPNLCEVKKCPKRNVTVSGEDSLQENRGTEKVIPLTEQRRTEGGASRGGGPCPRACPGGGASHGYWTCPRGGTCPWVCPWEDVLISGFCLLLLLMLPLNLSVNVPLFVSVDKVLQQTLKNVRFSEDVLCHEMNIV